MQWTDELRADLETRWTRGDKRSRILFDMELTPGQLAGRITKYNLPPRGGRSPSVRLPLVVKRGRSLYSHLVQPPSNLVLKPGDYQKKLGAKVQKGPWKDFQIHSLTLEERATCPRSCAMYVQCYGNNMGMAVRYQHGPNLERQIWRELHRLNRKRGKLGFVVRLHILGDFYNPSYVDLWEAALDHFPRLRVFGYTAHPRGTPIGDAVHRLRTERWDRFAVRTSGAPDDGHPRSVVIRHDQKPPAGAIICPEQTGKTATCSTCGLCWHTKKTIAFLEH